MTPLRVGIQLPEVERDVRWPEVVAMAQAAERGGFDSLWLGDHLLYRHDGREERGPWEVWTQLAAIAAVTERIELGPLVACASFHSPGVLAKMAASVDEVSGGRLVLGLGAGSNLMDHEAFGLPRDRLVSRFEEAFEIVRRLVAGERVTFRGRWFEVDDAVLLPAPARRIPLMAGTTGERMLGITLPHVDWWNTWYLWFENRPERFADLNRRVDEAARRAGRDPRDVRRSGCLLVELDPSAVRRPRDKDVEAIPAARLPEALREMAEAGADEAILVVRPITEDSIRELGAVLPGRATL